MLTFSLPSFLSFLFHHLHTEDIEVIEKSERAMLERAMGERISAEKKRYEYENETLRRRDSKAESVGPRLVHRLIVRLNLDWAASMATGTPTSFG